MPPSRVTRFDSLSPEYSEAFHTFLAHTDQKQKAIDWLDREVGALARRRTAIDAGAGTGKLTGWLAERFSTVIGVEPNPTLAREFRAACPGITLIPETILGAEPESAADFVLCSHVFYYIPQLDWEANLRQMMGWLAPQGVLAIAIQNPDTDCMRMVDHFVGGRYDLSNLSPVALSEPGASYEVRLDTVEAHIETDDLQTACRIAEFMLNVVALPDPPTWAALQDYVARQFAAEGSKYRFSCHQDFLRIGRA